MPGSELTAGLPVVTSTATLAIQVPVLTVLGGNDFTTCGPNPQGGDFDCSSGRAVATQEAPFYSPEARIHGCVIPDSGHDVNLAVNHPLAAADMITWSFAFVGQLASVNNQGFDGSYRGLPWNDGLAIELRSSCTVKISASARWESYESQHDTSRGPNPPIVLC